MSTRRATAWIVLFAVLAALGGGLLSRGGSPVPRFGRGGGGAVGRDQTVPAVVVRVVDGDTIRVRVHGRRDTVRYIGIDTPETVKPGTPVQCFGQAASAFNHRLVDGQRVTLHTDAEPRDRYGRLLAYVFRARDGLFVNARLVRDGFARTLTIPPNVAHEADLARLEQAARVVRRGLWHVCE